MARGPRNAPTSKVPPWSPTATPEEARAFAQQRLALFTRLWCCMLPLFVVCVLGLYAVYPALRPRQASTVHGIAAAVLVPLGGLAVYALHRRRLSLRALLAIDAGGVAAIGALFGLSTYVSAPDLRVTAYTAFIWHTFVIFTRAIIVPSTPRRTFAVSSLAYVPLLIGGIALAIEYPDKLEIPAPAFVLVGGMFAVAAILLATTGTSVIFGLRKQVRAAQMGQYTLDGKIGEGGMGAVHRAHHAMLRRPTAIKLLPPSKFDASALARFEREVHHMSQLTHPNTVAIYDFGRSLDGVFYYAMEYLDGADLETVIERDGPQPAARVIHILQQICGALDEAHRRGLTHRDVKPSNVMLCRRGGLHDVAKVVDFGLVKEIAQPDDDRPTLSVGRHAIVGTPQYLSPEAITDPARVGPRSDLYALGAVGYFLVTGQRVFEGTTVELCRHHVGTQPTPPSLRTARPIPAELERLLLACLAKDPADRPASARALAAALGELVVEPAWTEDDAAAWWGRFEVKGGAEAMRSAVTSDGASPLTVELDRSTGMTGGIGGIEQPR